jgi:hypothetical protein
MSMDPRWNNNDRKAWRKITLTSILSGTNPTQTDPGANPGLRGERPVTNCQSHSTAINDVKMFFDFHIDRIYFSKFFETRGLRTQSVYWPDYEPKVLGWIPGTAGFFCSPPSPTIALPSGYLRYSSWGLELTIHLHSVRSSRISGFVPPLLHTYSLCYL